MTNEEIVAKYVGKTITKMNVVASYQELDKLVIGFNDDTHIGLSDEQSGCCNRTYMTADGDDLSYYIGSKLLGVEVLDGPESIEESAEANDCHEIQFLNIQTSTGVAAFSNHNEHNGYYGGFDLKIREIK